MKNDRKSLRPEFEKQTSQELEKILHTELERENPDRETVLQILDILETRDSGTSTDKEMSTHDRRKGLAAKRWIKGVAAAMAIILVLAFAAPPVFGAENIVEMVGRWTQDLFALFKSDSPDQLQTEYVYRTSNPDLQKIYDAAVENGITQRVVPTWVPEGCVLEELVVKTSPERMDVYAYFSGNNHYIIISLEPQDAMFFKKYPKNDGDAKVCEIEGKEHYIMPNADAWIAIWASGDVGCSIITNYSEETVRYILQSIYEEGD